ncbi:hypothetical protein JX265_013622 [Neoarthrinium moseri]|uniref:Xylanolytic transcriptional activator regulatory domain-containing protein n=1 Tax=Neoarthrinium moseri TaxID=1658444 RepID=A0A9Q0AIE6_9PEZI|nr:hypothetical protein JX265_013622 [Neoarthrinium moseri]
MASCNTDFDHRARTAEDVMVTAGEKPLEPDVGEVEHARPRKRTWRACDKCSIQRARCDGAHPCRRCEGESVPQVFHPKDAYAEGWLNISDYGYTCSYDRPVKKRGRTRMSTLTEINVATAGRESLEHASTRMPSASTNSSLSFLVDAVNDGSTNPHQADSAETRSSKDLGESHDCGDLGDDRLSISSRPSPSFVGRSSVSTVGVPCRYRVLGPVLPYLDDIISVPTACDLFDVFLTDPGSSLFRYAPPYILTRIFRRKSLLDPTNPRPVSAALLATILWCCAQAAEVPSLLLPGARRRTTKALYDLAVALINERTENHYWMRDAQTASELAAVNTGEKGPRASLPAEGHDDDIESLLGAVDDVLTFTLLCVAVSGGEFKADCQEWWHRATRTSRSLGLHREDEPCALLGAVCLKPLCSCRMQSRTPTLAFLEAKEERRRAFWLLYCLDRHLGLSFNRTLHIPDSYVEVYAPLPEAMWEELDELPDIAHFTRILGPPTSISGTSFFEYFLPLMVILGDIIELHHGRQHPRFCSFATPDAAALIEQEIQNCEASLGLLESEAHMHSRDNRHRTNEVHLVMAYATHIIRVLQVLLYSKWDPISMLDNDDGWISTEDFSRCASYAIAASEAVSRILELDPELAFMPYLFGIYLLQGSFILLLFADRMPQLGLNQSVAQACETVIRAHEVCIVTLSTEFQRSFRRVVRSTLYSVRGISGEELEEYKLMRRRVLSLYRWTKGARGLGI